MKKKCIFEKNVFVEMIMITHLFLSEPNLYSDIH